MMPMAGGVESGWEVMRRNVAGPGPTQATHCVIYFIVRQAPCAQVGVVAARSGERPSQLDKRMRFPETACTIFRASGRSVGEASLCACSLPSCSAQSTMIQAPSPRHTLPVSETTTSFSSGAKAPMPGNIFGRPGECNGTRRRGTNTLCFANHARKLEQRPQWSSQITASHFMVGTAKGG